MAVNAKTEMFDHIELFGKPALFTNFRIDRSTFRRQSLGGMRAGMKCSA